MEQENKIIFISITLSFMFIFLFNVYLDSYHFVPYEKGVEAWIDDVNVKEVYGSYNINVNFTIKNLYDHQESFIYYIRAYKNDTEVDYLFNCVVVPGNEKYEINSNFALDSKPDLIKIEINNGEYFLELFKKNW